MKKVFLSKIPTNICHYSLTVTNIFTSTLFIICNASLIANFMIYKVNTRCLRFDVTSASLGRVHDDVTSQLQQQF